VLVCHRREHKQQTRRYKRSTEKGNFGGGKKIKACLKNSDWNMNSQKSISGKNKTKRGESVCIGGFAASMKSRKAGPGSKNYSGISV